GMMKFDTADLDNLGIRLNDVILHEMGHVLGFGTLWNFLTNALLSQPGSGDPFFNGAASRGAFLAAAATGTTFTGNPVPVENSGGAGTRDAHWREATVTTELMTGFISAPGIQNPLSAFTATSFRDMGYVVNDAVADAFTFQAALMAALAPAPLSSPLGAFRLVEAPLPDPILVINRHGRVIRRVPRY
ncbi:MAG TPA: leishmanolysin-related zinc metalloendopeptidase, partial [Gemmatimonadales bacterium]